MNCSQCGKNPAECDCTGTTKLTVCGEIVGVVHAPIQEVRRLLGELRLSDPEFMAQLNERARVLGSKLEARRQHAEGS